MADYLIFESRKGNLSCEASVFFDFITDIRNLGQFIPEGSMKNWEATTDSCSFGVPPLAIVKVRISEKNPFSLVCFSGDALQKDDFNLKVEINNNENISTEIKLTLSANLNPVLKIMASGPIEKFLETLISEMEKFDNWNYTFKES